MDELFLCYDSNSSDGMLDRREAEAVVQDQLDGKFGECENDDNLDSALLTKNS